MNNVISFNSIPANRSEQKVFAANCIKSIVDGEVNPIQAVAQLKSISEVIAACLKDENVKEAVINECDKYGKGEHPSFNGASIQVKESAVKYDYLNTGDPIYKRLVDEQADINAKVKAREKFLCSLSVMEIITDKETGEMVEVYPPAKSSSTTFAITFAK